MDKIKPKPIQRFSYPSLVSLLNLWALEDNALIGLDLQFSLCYELTLPDLTLQNEDEQISFFNTIKALLHNLPDNITIQFLQTLNIGNDKIIDEYSKTTQPDTDLEKFIVSEKIKHLKKAYTKNKKTYLFITTKAIADKEKTIQPLIRNSNGIIDKNIHNMRINKITELSKIFVSGLQNAGIQTRKLTDQEIINLLYKHLNPSRSEILDIRQVASDKTLREQLIYNACEVNFDYIYIDGYYYRAVNLYFRPESINFVDLINTLNQFIPDCDISISINTGEQDKLQKNLQNKANIAKGVAGFSLLANHEALSKRQDAEDLIEETKTTSQKFFEYSFCVVLKDRTLEKLTEKANIALLAFRNFGEADGIIDDINTLKLYLSVLPNHTYLNDRKHIFNSEAISQMLPLSCDWTGSNTPKLLFQTEDDQLLPLDLFDPTLSAKHGLIIGQTGAGKSFTTNFLLTNFFIENPNNHIIIIDIGGSYRKLCKLFGGSYLDIELSEQFAFNPLPKKSDAVISDDPFEVEPDVVANISLLIQKMTNKQSYTNEEQMVIDTAIQNTYKYNQQDVLLQDLVFQLKNFKSESEIHCKIAKEFASSLELFTFGRYGKLFNRPSKLNLKDRIVVFDLQKLSEDLKLQSIIFFVIQTAIYGKLKNINLKKMIVIDEGWRFFDDETGSLLISNLYRTARKFNAAIYAISQSPLEFLNTKAANAMISNSYLKYVLRIKSGFELLTQFGLTKQDREKVENLRLEKGKFSEIFLKFNEHSRVIKIEPNKTDYYICTTDPDDRKIEDDIRAKNPNATELEILKKVIGDKI